MGIVTLPISKTLPSGGIIAHSYWARFADHVIKHILWAASCDSELLSDMLDNELKQYNGRTVNGCIQFDSQEDAVAFLLKWS